MKHSLSVVTSSLALSFAVSAAHADVLVSGIYSNFSFGAVGSSGTPSYTETGAGTITVLDGFLDGDQFKVYDNGVLLGNTSTPVNDGTNCGNNPAVCYANPDFSRGTFAVGAGLNAISIVVLLDPLYATLGGGAAFIGENVEPLATSVTPEPGSLVLLGTGMLGILGAVRRRLQA